MSDSPALPSEKSRCEEVGELALRITQTQNVPTTPAPFEQSGEHSDLIYYRSLPSARERAKPRNPKKLAKAQVWDDNRPTISELFFKGKTYEEIAEKLQPHLPATKASVKNHLKRWHMKRHLNNTEAIFIVQTNYDRRLKGLKTEFRTLKGPISILQAETHLRRNGFSITDVIASERQSTAPAGITIATPPLSPQPAVTASALQERLFWHISDSVYCFLKRGQNESEGYKDETDRSCNTLSRAAEIYRLLVYAIESLEAGLLPQDLKMDLLFEHFKGLVKSSSGTSSYQLMVFANFLSFKGHPQFAQQIMSYVHELCAIFKKHKLQAISRALHEAIPSTDRDFFHAAGDVWKESFSKGSPDDYSASLWFNNNVKYMMSRVNAPFHAKITRVVYDPHQIDCDYHTRTVDESSLQGISTTNPAGCARGVSSYAGGKEAVFYLLRLHNQDNEEDPLMTITLSESVVALTTAKSWTACCHLSEMKLYIYVHYETCTSVVEVSFVFSPV